MVRDFKKEYRDYHGTPEQRMRRAERNRARYKAEKEGRVNAGEEVHHVDAPRKGSLENVPTRVVKKAVNRKIQPKRT
jgi:hypothetical protein